MKRSSIAVGILAVIPFVGVVAISLLLASYWKSAITTRPLGRPRAVVKKVEKDYLRRGFIGIDYTPLAAENLDATRFGSGVLVKSVLPGSPAAESGIEVGNYLVAVDGAEVGNSEELKLVCAGWQPGQVVELTVVQIADGLPVEKDVECRLISFDEMQKLGLPAKS